MINIMYLKIIMYLYRIISINFSIVYCILLLLHQKKDKKKGYNDIRYPILYPRHTNVLFRSLQL